MASWQEAIQTALLAEDDWTDLVTGGTHLLDDLGPNGLTLDKMQVDDNGLYKLTAVITISSGGVAELAHRSERRFFHVRLYDDVQNGWGNIREAAHLLKLLPGDEGGILNRRQIVGDGVGSALIEWVNPGPEFYDESLGGLPASFERFYVQFRRVAVS